MKESTYQRYVSSPERKDLWKRKKGRYQGKETVGVLSMRTPKNILRHELIGLNCEIVSSKNKSQIGIRGRIADETMKTLVIKTEKSQKRIQKQDCTFRVKLDTHTVDISGNFIISRPEDRIKKKFNKW